MANGSGASVRLFGFYGFKKQKTKTAVVGPGEKGKGAQTPVFITVLDEPRLRRIFHRMGSEASFSTSSLRVENSRDKRVDGSRLFSTAFWDGFRVSSAAALSVGFVLRPQKSPLTGAEVC